MQTEGETPDWAALGEEPAPPESSVLDVIVELSGSTLARQTHALCRRHPSTGVLQWFEPRTNLPLSAKVLFPAAASAAIWQASTIRVTHWRLCRCAR